MHPATIGPFRIDRELGRGGMGEVFLATDTRLHRQVAIKALPAHLASDPDRLVRFQREAKVLASLNHPGIAAIYGLEEASGHQYLVLEFVAGETLTERVKRGAIPMDEALALAKQIAEALEAAHEKGVVHRDVKPGNVMVTGDGVVKVLDFGLARTVDGTPSTSNVIPNTDSPTVTWPGPAHSPTIPGAIMGTAGYMSPEQARGKPVDRRSDIFSFGCVVYEMLTGAQPFAGETVTDSLGAILHREPNWALLPPGTPARVRELLAHCLAKDRKSRLHDIADARLALERATTEPKELAQAVQGQCPWWRSPAVLVSASLLALAIAISLLEHRSSPGARQNERTVIRSTLALPKGMVLLQSDRGVAVSPDGTQVVVSLLQKDGTSSPSLFLRELSRLEFRTLPGTEEATYPFWSPDGKSIAFFAGRKLKRIDLDDRIVRVLCDAPAGRGGSWGSKGAIVFAPSAGGGLSIVSDSGGAASPITTSAAPWESHRVPQMLPDGRRFLYFVHRTSTEADGVYAFDPVSRKSRLVLAGSAEALFVEPGFLVFARDENLMAQPFDLERLELRGSARPIAAGVQYHKVRAFINAGISSRGTLIYQLVNPAARFRLAWMDRKGERTPVAVEPIPVGFSGGSLSKDARRLAVTLDGDRAESSVAIVDLERGINTRLSDPAVTFVWNALWASDEQGVLGSEQREGRPSIVSFPIGGGAPTRILEGEAGFEYELSSITPDGKTLIFTQDSLRDKNGNIMTLRLEKDQTARRYLQTPEAKWAPRISPSGEVVAYLVTKAEETTGALKVIPYPTPSAPVQVSATLCSLDFGWLGTNALYWVDASRRLWSAVISSKDARLDASVPKPMFEGRLLEKQTRVLAYDIPRERFLIAIEDEPREDPRLVVVNDWHSEPLGERPARK
jgi:serine/threonine protein kinase